jgi:hypothetical protein
VRAVVLIVCALGVVGMIVASALDSNGAALTFGLITVSAIVCLIVATAVSVAVSGAVGSGGPPAEARAERVEALISDLVAAGADETAVRNLVREASGLRGLRT